jgi:putative endonuclease
VTSERFYVYILASEPNRVLYVGMTGDLIGRVHQHRNRLVPGFTCRYNVTKLVYFEEFPDAWSSIEREKQLKAGSRRKKLLLIEHANPEWRDLYDSLLEPET